MKRCNYCAEEIQDEAVVCRHCGRDLVQAPISHRGTRYGVGAGPDFYGLWDLQAPASEPLQRFPRTEQGWREAWTEFTKVDRPVETRTAAGSGQGFMIAAWVCGGLAVLILPIVLGPLGIVFGAIAHSRGEKGGMPALVFSIVMMVLGFVLGYLAIRGEIG